MGGKVICDNLDKGKIMDIFEFAKEKEQLSRDLYQQMAKKAPDEGLANIFNMLADEEEHHIEVVEKLQHDTEHDVAETTVLSDAKKAFEKIRDGAKNFSFDVSEEDVYAKARDIEEESMNFYKEKAGDVDADWKKNIFLKLADEEKKHFHLMSNICDFVSRPDTWLEDAEFYHLEKY